VIYLAYFSFVSNERLFIFCTCRLHLYNARQKEKLDKAANRVTSIADQDEVTYVAQFGFHLPTSCGFIAQDNTWEDDWPVRVTYVVQFPFHNTYFADIFCSAQDATANEFD
jgi:hypothetical protein